MIIENIVNKLYLTNMILIFFTYLFLSIFKMKLLIMEPNSSNQTKDLII